MNLMNLNEYQQLAGRTLLDTPDQMPTGLEYMLMWNGLGLAVEAGEIAELFTQDLINLTLLRKELGDVLWYVAAICSKLGITMQTAWQADPLQSIDPRTAPARRALFLVASAASVVDSLKKQICHRHGLNVATLIPQLGTVISAVDALCSAYDLSIASVMETNIEKLHQRYKDGYSSAASKDWQATR